MNAARRYGRLLLWFHLFICLIWLAFVRSLHSGPIELPDWMGHLMVWSILGIQFSWGFTVGLLVGPSRARRDRLWWSLLTVFLPLWPIGWILFAVAMTSGPLIALAYTLVFTMILACETFCGVLLGVKAHSSDNQTD
jgi:hypothetical protein